MSYGRKTRPLAPTAHAPIPWLIRAGPNPGLRSVEGRHCLDLAGDRRPDGRHRLPVASEFPRSGMLGPGATRRGRAIGGLMTLGYETVDSRLVHRNHIMTITVERVRMPGGQIAERDVIDRLGAVVIVALDERDRVFLVSQYRHPVGGFLAELPAGLLDKPAEPAADAARRELFEEAGLRATTWHTLLDLRLTPAAMNHRVRVYLARELTVVPAAERYELGQGGEYEEAEIRGEWVALTEAVRRALAGEIQNDAAVAGILAAAAAKADDWRPLRPATLPWPPRLVAE